MQTDVRVLMVSLVPRERLVTLDPREMLVPLDPLELLVLLVLRSVIKHAGYKQISLYLSFK